DVLAAVARHGARHVTVTGGEPLAQKNCLPLLTRLCDAGHSVSIETTGALPIAPLDPRGDRAMGRKRPGAARRDNNPRESIPALRASDQVKFVICDRADYEWTRAQTAEHRLSERCQVLFSPSHEQVHPKDLAEWILADHLPVRLQVQLHKYLWGNVPGH